MEEKKPSLARFEELVRENEKLRKENDDLKARLEAMGKEKEKDEDDLEF